MSEQRTAPIAYGRITVVCQGDGTEEGWCGTTVSTPLEVGASTQELFVRARCSRCRREWVVKAGIEREELDRRREMRRKEMMQQYRHCCQLGCPEKAEFVIRWGNAPDDYTESCYTHVGELLSPGEANIVWEIAREEAGR